MKKKNLFLFFLLLILLSLTYYWEEVYKRKQVQDVQEKLALIVDIPEIQKIDFPNFTIQLEKDKWKLKGFPFNLSKEKVNLLFKFLDGMKISSKISTLEKKNEEYFSKNDLSFQVTSSKGSFNYKIGRISPVSGRFFVQSSLLRDLVLVIENSSPIQSAYINEADKLNQNYDQLQSILKSNGSFLLEENLLTLNGVNLNNFTQVRIDGRHNRWFELNLKEQTTFPLPFKDIKVHPLQHHFKSIFSRMKVRNLNIFKQRVLSEKRGTITFKGESTLVLEYFKSLNSEYGNFVRIKGEPHVYSVEFLDLNIFETNVQHFWRKRIDYHTKFSDIKVLNFNLSLKTGKDIKCQIDDLDSFEVKTTDSRVENISKPHVNFLFNLILNLTDFVEAKYIMLIEEEKPLADYDIAIELLDKTLGIKIDPNHIIVYDKSNELEYFYDYDKVQIKEDFFDQLIELKKDGTIESN